MTDDLQTKFAVLTDARPEPSDPAAPIRLRIKRRQRRRRGTAAVLLTAAAVAVTLATGPALGALRGGAATGGGGFAAPVTAATSTPSIAKQNVKLPPPWSDRKFTRLPDANAYRPAAYYVAEGTISTEKWAILSVDGSCLVADERQVGSFGTPFVCFATGGPGGPWGNVGLFVEQAHTREKSTVKLDHSLVLGVASVEARKVRIVAGGKTYDTDAVGTPTTNQLRFFAIEIPQRDLKITSITALDAAGHRAPRPHFGTTQPACSDSVCVSATPSN